MPLGIRNGTPADQLFTTWRKSSYSGKQGNCVALGPLTGSGTAVHDTRDPRGPALIYPRNKMAAFLAAAKDGAFDGPHR